MYNEQMLNEQYVMTATLELMQRHEKNSILNSLMNNKRYKLF